MRRRILKTLALPLLLLGMALPAGAVSQKEMEQARTITAFWYLRYANNGAGYMEDGKMPSTMAELEKMLKETERTNLKAFKSVSVPSDYASWDKKKLVGYWAGTFFNSPGLSAQGKVARKRVETKLNAMTVAAPAPAEETPAQPVPTTEAEPAEAAAPAEVPAEAAGIPTAQDIVEQAQTVDSAALAAESAADDGETRRKSSSSTSTWIYIIALIVLVGIVIWLVIFASKTMQEGNAKSAPEDPDKRMPEPMPAASPVAAEPRRQPEIAAEEAGETRAMRREIKGLREECMRLGEENGRLQSDLADARREIEALRGRLRAANAVTSAASAASAEPVRDSAPRGEQPARASRPVAAPRRPEPADEADEVREIYLGRVNPKGLFVRADKQPVAGKSVFVLATTDGYTGSYRVLQMPEVIERCLDNPDHYLAGGCTAPDILATEDAEQIRTLQSGTAIFENGCWRMIRKTKIVYE